MVSAETATDMETAATATKESGTPKAYGSTGATATSLDCTAAYLPGPPGSPIWCP
jgi:hypothetical protein